MRSYWVESIAYSTPACRILLSDTDYSSVLDPYDPTVGDGPWWLSSTGEHYWNGNYCLEVMLEGDIDLRRATTLDFVKHHPNRCNIDYHTCRYKGIDAQPGGAEFVAAAVSRGISLELPGLVEVVDQSLKPSWAIEGAVGRLLRHCDRIGGNCSGKVEHVDPAAPALARAVLASMGNPDIAKDLEKLAAQFKSSDDLQFAVADAVAASVGLPDGSTFLDD